MALDAKDWSDRLHKAERHEQDYRPRAEKVIKKYRDERAKTKSGANPIMNLLWANTETLRPSLYSQQPRPLAIRRFKQQDPTARSAARILERLLSFSMDNGVHDFDAFMKLVVNDLLLPGRSVDRVLLEPLFDDDDNEVAQSIRYHHTPWMHFAYDPQTRWQDVHWRAYGDHFFSREELLKTFESVTTANISELPVIKVERDEEMEERFQVWLIQDRDSEQWIWHIKDAPFLLSEEAPPVALAGFFDGPDPLYSFTTNDDLVPLPEYTFYQYQAEEINKLTARIHGLTDRIRANYAFAGQDKDAVENLLTLPDGTGVPIANWTQVLERGGVDAMLGWVPVEGFAKTLQILIARRQELIQQVFEITGISDILRGNTDPRETARAQSLKATFGGRRLLPRQREVQKYIRDLLRIGAEIMVEEFSPDTITDIVGQDASPEVIGLLRDDTARAYKIDIETDSTIALDEQQEKQEIAEFLGAVGQFMQLAQGLAQFGPGGTQLAAQVLLWAMRRFRAGRDIEELLEQAIANPPEQQDPNAQQAQADAQAAQAQIAREDQLAQARIAREDALAQARMQRDTQGTVTDIQLEQAETAAKIRARERESRAREAQIRRRASE